MSKIVVEGRYHWNGFECGLRSKERGVRIGDVRVIDGALFRAYLLDKLSFGRSEVPWIPLTEDELKPYSTGRVFGGFSPRNYVSYEWEKATQEEIDKRLKKYPMQEREGA